MDTLITICAILCGIIGILGSVLPVLPGPALSFVGMVLAYFNGGDTITVRMLFIRCFTCQFCSNNCNCVICIVYFNIYSWYFSRKKRCYKMD